MLLLASLIIGFVQMALARILGFHNGIEHMQHGDNYLLYAVEAGFYSLAWCGILYRQKFKADSTLSRDEFLDAHSHIRGVR